MSDNRQELRYSRAELAKAFGLNSSEMTYGQAKIYEDSLTSAQRQALDAKKAHRPAANKAAASHVS